MNKIVQSFKSKKFKYGTFSTLTTIFVFAILLIINLVAIKLDVSYDLSMDQLYSISDESKKVLAELKEEVTVYALFRSGEESPIFKNLLDDYAKSSKLLKVVYKDPVSNPTFVTGYSKDGASIPVNSLIVVSEKRNKIISANDLYTIDYYSGSDEITSIDLEPQLTNALKYVTEDTTKIIYKVTGHNEAALSETLKKQISLANYEMKDLDFMIENKVPEDCTLLFITTPLRDYTAAEAEAVTAFLQNDGKAIILLDYVYDNYENIKGILASYGAEIKQAVIFEGNKQNMYPNAPVWLMPNMVEHELTGLVKEKGYRTIIPAASPIYEMELKKQTIQFAPLFVTSTGAYAKMNPNPESENFEPGDLEGSFTVAAAITDSYYTDREHSTKLVVIGASSILDETVNMYSNGGNDDFIMSSLSWLAGKDSGIYIRPKTQTANTQLLIDDLQALLISFAAVILLPSVIMGTGYFIWHRRRSS